MKSSIKDVELLLKEYRSSCYRVFKSGKVKFIGAERWDVYNTTAPFLDAGEVVIAGRRELRESELADVLFFGLEGEGWRSVETLPSFKMQDPFVSFIGGELVLGGVEISPKEGGGWEWRTLFYKGKSAGSLKPLFSGPVGMKDIRIAELPNKKIALFTRPQGEKGGRGKIGFLLLDSLDQLTVEAINKAPLFDLFPDHQWGGVNEIHLLPDGRLGILAHVARYSKEPVRHYYPAVFTVTPETGEYTPMKIIAERRDFQPGSAKRRDLEDVLFAGGLVRHSNGTATLYTGVGDSHSQWGLIVDPFTY